MPPSDDLVAAALDALDGGDLGQAVAMVGAALPARTAGAAFVTLAKRLYRERRSVAGMISVSEAGIAFCLDQAAADPSSAAALKRLAKVIAYNAAANCWPGWGDAGVAIEPSQLAAGSALAGRCRALVGELALGGRELGNAEWLIGALDLAAGRSADAGAAFARAEAAFLAAGEAAYALMAAAYAALARKADPQTRFDGERALALALDRLRAEGSRDAAGFAEQVATADRLLLVTPPLIGSLLG